MGANTNYEQATAAGCVTIWQGVDYGNTYNKGNHRCEWDFSANRSSSIFGNSSRVQPTSIALLPCIKL